MGDLEAQQDEITVLSSIYEQEVFRVDESSSKPVCGQLAASLEIPESYKITCKIQDGDSANEGFALDIKNLPPVVLHFLLPENYPSETAPRYTLSCKWLSRHELSKLCEELDRIWEESAKGGPVLFEWLQFLQEQALTYLGITNSYDLTWFYRRQKYLVRNASKQMTRQESEETKMTPSKDRQSRLDNRTVQDISPDVDLAQILLDYDSSVQRTKFEAEYHPCNICFEDKPGSRCLRFVDCSHVFCKDCMKSYLEVNIQEGSVNELKCPGEKCLSPVLAFQVRELVLPELYTRYDALLLASSLASMPDLGYCPRPTCQYPIIIDRANNMGSCPSCSFNFCVFCNMTYHGVAPCKFSREECRKIYEDYMAADWAEKELMEKRYGKKQLEIMMTEVPSEDWIKQNSKPCPKCGTHIEKIDGCNKMLCWSCSSAFCWLCLDRLNKSSPYSHFEDPHSLCHNRLFEGIEIDDM